MFSGKGLEVRHGSILEAKQHACVPSCGRGGVHRRCTIVSPITYQQKRQENFCSLSCTWKAKGRIHTLCYITKGATEGARVGVWGKKGFKKARKACQYHITSAKVKHNVRDH